MGRTLVHCTRLSQSVLSEIPWLFQVFPAMGTGQIPRLAQSNGCMSRVGIIVAMRAEARCITVQRLPFDQNLPLRENLFIRISGMGGAAAQRAAAALHG